MYSKNNLPSNGDFIRVDLMYITKSCGPRMIGYYVGSTKDYLLLSDLPLGGNVAQVGWSAITLITPAKDTDQVCVEF